MLKLYAEVERTGRAHQFEEKLGIRDNFGRTVGDIFLAFLGHHPLKTRFRLLNGFMAVLKKTALQACEQTT